MNAHIVGLFPASGRDMTSFILSSIAVTKFQGNSLSGGVKYAEWEKFAIFDRNSRLYRKLYERGSWLLSITNRKS